MTCCSRHRPSVLLAGALAGALAAGVSAAAPPRIDRPIDYLDTMMGRPYNGGTPLRTTGTCAWASHPIGWGFQSGMHYVHFNDMEMLKLEARWNGVDVEPGPGWATESHLTTWALPPGDLALNPSRSDYPAIDAEAGNPWLTIDGDRRDTLVWHHRAASGEVALELSWGEPVTIASVLLHLVEDPARGFSLPDSVRLEWRAAGAWLPVENVTQTPAAPAAGPNFIAFDAVATAELRVVLSSAAEVAVAELEAYTTGRMPLELIERKFVSPDDVLVSVLEARNLGTLPHRLTVDATSPIARTRTGPALTGSETLSWIKVKLRVELEGSRISGRELTRDLLLPAGASARLTAVMALARSDADAAERAAAWLGASDPIAEGVAATGRWFFDHAPQLDVPDPWFEKAYAYRWQVLRRNLTDPKAGELQHPTFTEGRWTSSWFPVVITYGAMHQLREARWLRDPSYARGHVLTFVDNQRGDGAFRGATVDSPGREYTDWISSAIWDLYLVSGDRELLQLSIDAMQRNLDYMLTRDRDGDALPLVEDHFESGMEWQPAYFYFNEFRTDDPTPLERVDYAAALYANAMATASAARVLDDAARLGAAKALAHRVRDAVIQKMWDADTTFYYSLREADDKKAMVREIVGFYPFAFGLPPVEHESAFALLTDPDEFWSTWPPASSSLASPATSMDGWPIGPGGSQAMWNGPTWPHSISMVTDAVGRTIRRSGEEHVTRAQLFHLIERYTKAQFCCVNEDRDFQDPQIGEYYHGWRGFWKTSDRDYFHSTYVDMVITQLIGLQPTEAPVVRVDPLLPPGTWDRFLLDRARYRGHEVTVVWDEPGGDDAYGDGREGLDLYVDGQRAASRTELGKLEVPLPPTKGSR